MNVREKCGVQLRVIRWLKVRVSKLYLVIHHRFALPTRLLRAVYGLRLVAAVCQSESTNGGGGSKRLCRATAESEQGGCVLEELLSILHKSKGTCSVPSLCTSLSPCRMC